MIIHLNGWPGAGKRAIGELLACKLGARFIHNHLLHDVAIVCAGFDSPDRWALYDQVRKAAYQGLRKRPTDELFVLTNALCKTSSREVDAWGHVVRLAMERNVSLLPVVLELDGSENIRRVQSAERVGKKMSNPHALRECFAEHALQYPDVPETFVLDVTSLEADEAAERLLTHIKLVEHTLTPATLDHLLFR
jgi:gluconate kinase